ncbi:hypothetical protein ACGF8B_25665 [Streptomyces sp. NPDC047917]|uniref:hypothetical protein n=1 Tax=Streptomyces sp. NPDC047917 TaxID=3365491 RepID=UPI0037157B06
MRLPILPAHQQAAMPEEYLEGRTTGPATWLHTPKNLGRLAAFTQAAEARSRIVADGPRPKQPVKDADDPARRQQHYTTQPEQDRAGEWAGTADGDANRPGGGPGQCGRPVPGAGM